MKIYLFVLTALLFAAGCSTSTSPAEKTTSSGSEASASPGSETGSSGGPVTVNAAPKDALIAFVKAVKAKDEAGVKAALSEKTFKMLVLEAKLSGKKDATLFDSEVFEDIGDMPEVRNEKIDGQKASLEVREKSDEDWTPLPLVLVEGSWRLAFADEAYDKSYEDMSKMSAGDLEKPKNPESKSDSGKDPTASGPDN